jgi:choline-sulfatase
MMQVPMIVSHPKKIAPGETDIMISNTDFLPSILEHVGLKNRIPNGTNQKLSGRSYAPLLRGESIKWETAMYYEMEGTRSVRTENWKYVARQSPVGPGELYDMAADPHERFNVFGQPEHSAVQAELGQQLEDWFNEYATAEYDIWKGGRSKARRLHAPKDHPDYRPLRTK